MRGIDSVAPVAGEIVFSQLMPRPREVGPERVLEEVDFRALAADSRPRTLVNFVASLDGRATFAGRSGTLGDEGDRAMFHALREQVDAVLAGIGTMATEGYGRILGKPERRERRIAKGLPDEPLACVITRSGQVPMEIPLFACADARVAVFAPPGEFDLAACQAQVELRELPIDELNPRHVLNILRHEFGVRSLLCEGGPRLFAGLLAAGVVDELFLTIAPKLTGGGTAPSMTTGPELPDLVPARIRWVLERASSLFIRYELEGLRE